MESLPAVFAQVPDYANQGLEIAKTWLQSPAAWSQFALLVAAFIVAWVASRWLTYFLTKFLTPSEEKQSIIAQIQRLIFDFLPLLLPTLAYFFIGIGEDITRSVFGSGAVIAFGKRFFLFIAARILVRQVLKDPFLKLLGKVFLIPLAAIYALGLLDETLIYLNATVVSIGNIKFSIMALIRAGITGSLLFWLGRWSNERTTTYIGKQEELRPATRELAAKSAEIMIFGTAFLLLMNILGISLTTLAVLGGAIGVGLGFGLQRIAANFISGIILLLEGQATVGDFVELDGGEAGTIIKTTARAMILETFDGRWIVVPNEDFITTRVVNYSDSGSANRYEARFSVAYHTDINAVPDIVEVATASHPDVLTDPFPPDCELRGFGDSGVDFTVEFWVNGIDDGANKYTSDVLFLLWNALKDNGIEIPYPQRVVHFRGAPEPLPKAMPSLLLARRRMIARRLAETEPGI